MLAAKPASSCVFCDAGHASPESSFLEESRTPTARGLRNNAGELGLRRYSGSGQTSWERDERQGHCTEGQPPSPPCRPSTARVD